MGWRCDAGAFRAARLDGRGAEAEGCERHAECARAGSPVCHQRPVFRGQRRFRRRPPLGLRHRSHAVDGHGLDFGIRRPARGESFSSAPGRRALGGGSDSPMPEDEPEYGSLWEHVAGAGLSIRNYGEGIEVEGADELEGAAPEGQRLVLNAPVPKPVFESSDRGLSHFQPGHSRSVPLPGVRQRHGSAPEEEKRRRH